MKRILSDSRFWQASLLIALDIVILTAWIGIWVHGKYFVCESNLFILVFETLGLLAILGFGIRQLIAFIKEVAKCNPKL
jgi:hypothetical protein